ncbi:LysR family transcriptional regulator [Thiomonas sp. FB-6]|uniref:LysR family transcriptional regulator n=1 Tax=Thiomonas sp. FB-6 TaxID=1158291 RepID=UPI000380CDC2|nr:LysR family transcriptional regulator [Thiomonas sp. FB-6]
MTLRSADSDSSERFFQRGIKLSQLRLLVLFAGLGQVRLVAQQLHLTQPAVSKQIAELEAGIGAPVLQRAGNRLRFTPVGEALLRRAREVLLQLEQARHDVHALSQGISGTVAVGAGNTVLPVIGPAFAMAMRRRAPSVRLRFVQGTSDTLFPRLESGELDLVFSRDAPASAQAGLQGQDLFDDPVLLVCGRDSPLASRPSLEPEDLRDMPWILPPASAPTFVALQAWMHGHGLEFPDGCIESTLTALNIELLLRYPFLGMLPRSLAEQAAQAGQLHILKLQDASFLGRVWLWRNTSSANPVVQVALDCARSLPGPTSAPVSRG